MTYNDVHWFKKCGIWFINTFVLFMIINNYNKKYFYFDDVVVTTDTLLPHVGTFSSMKIVDF